MTIETARQLEPGNKLKVKLDSHPHPIPALFIAVRGEQITVDTSIRLAYNTVSPEQIEAA